MPDSFSPTRPSSRVTIAPTGQLAIPVELLRALGLEAGGEVVARVENGCIVLEPFSSVVRRVQDHFQKYADPNRSIVDELIAERRAEAAREDEESGI